MTTRALVLSGGGIVGIAWETGLVAGLAEGDVDVSNADLIIGTSAGSVVGSQLALGEKPADLLKEALQEHLDAADEEIASPANIDMAALGELAKLFIGPEEMTRDVLREIGALALKTKTIDEERWVAPFRERTGGRAWPDKRLLLTAVDAESGEFVTWDRDSDVDLGLAVASSCTVPALFPPVTINGRRYIDGGVRSVNNADLAQGHDIVLIVAFLNMFSQFSGPLGRHVQEEINGLRESGSKVEVIAPDDAAIAAFGMNPMDISKRIDGAKEGLRQGRELADRLRPFWSAQVAAEQS